MERPTAGVTRKWAGVDSAWEAGKAQSQKNAKKRAAYTPSAAPEKIAGPSFFARENAALVLLKVYSESASAQAVQSSGGGIHADAHCRSLALHRVFRSN